MNTNPNYIAKMFEQDLVSNIFPLTGYQVLRKYGDRISQRQLGDFRILNRQSKNIKEVDAKAEWYVSRENFPIEIMQDWKSNDQGWYLHLNAHEIWYGRYIQGSRDLYDLHVIDLPKLKVLSGEITSRWKITRTTKNQGDTILALAPLSELVATQCARKVEIDGW